jgi:molybdenum cofactor cytidylyltransferase
VRALILIAAVVIASGYSRRMGRSKLALDLGGATFLERAIGAAGGASRVSRCLVVLRPEDLHRLAHPPGSGLHPSTVEVVANERAAEGQSASIRLATERLSADPTCEAIIFSVVDQPFLISMVFDLLAEAWEQSSGGILVSTYAGQRGSPVLFSRRYFPDLLRLTGDVGGRHVMRRYPEAVREVAMPDPEAGRDVDTWDEYLQACQAFAVTRSSSQERA